MSENTEFNRDRFIKFVANVRQEILNMQSGEGRWRPGALHFEKDTSPAMHRLQLLEDNPTEGNLKQFIELAKQDFGAATAKAFKDWSHSIFPEPPKEKRAPVVKAFDVAIKDGFYDFFKVARIPLEPKQIVLMEKTALRLATTFKTEIDRAVKERLEVLIQATKKKEEGD